MFSLACACTAVTHDRHLLAVSANASPEIQLGKVSRTTYPLVLLGFLAAVLTVLPQVRLLPGNAVNCPLVKCVQVVLPICVLLVVLAVLLLLLLVASPSVQSPI